MTLSDGPANPGAVAEVQIFPAPEPATIAPDPGPDMDPLKEPDIQFLRLRSAEYAMCHEASVALTILTSRCMMTAEDDCETNGMDQAGLNE